MSIEPADATNDETFVPTKENHPETSDQDHIQYFGEYELIEEIARGGMGVVFKAKQIKLNRIVAIKMILAGKLAGSKEVERFRREAEAAAKLDHPGIVPIYEIGDHEGQNYFSMGYIEGQSLAQVVSNNPLPPTQASIIVLKLSEAVAYAHAQGVIHRAPKPSNVLLDSDGTPRITDFGLAKIINSETELTKTGDVFGTPGYMPPEQAAGRTSDIGPISDVYSLGAILYCLLTARPPFHAATTFETINQVIDNDPVSPRSLNSAVCRDLETICLKCLEKHGNHRYQDANALKDDLQRFLDGRPITARPTGKLLTGLRWCRRNPAVSSLLGLVLIAAFSLIVANVGGVIVDTASKAGRAFFWPEKFKNNYEQLDKAIENYHLKHSKPGQ